MFRASLRAVPRSLPARAYQQQLRTATTSTAQRRFAVYQSQTTNSFVYASVGLAALLGWTAAILTVGGRGSKHSNKDAHAAKKDTDTPATEPAAAQSSAAPSANGGQAASQAAAFNPETGEINWDCPCLGGMAEGPCGEEFKAAFSCFIYSEAEPKGIDCVEKFRNMQECFRKHPDIYGDEDDDLHEEEEGFDLVSRAEAALALPDQQFLEEAAKESPTRKEAEAASTLE
ncbi:mitochondrial intermembrane space import and assembly protein [Rhodotorula toruloides]|uniref:Mitochondrial intermembrane space import and assembly protein 40 n=1 Tax=Rhodotorula toruloides TaxID=5286 RepID=A0A511KQS0_RHOTO|nr:mitochondrial intermembrane space import and assembly protein [Rhodotorula toruloides]